MFIHSFAGRGKIGAIRWQCTQRVFQWSWPDMGCFSKYYTKAPVFRLCYVWTQRYSGWYQRMSLSGLQCQEGWIVTIAPIFWIAWLNNMLCVQTLKLRYGDCVFSENTIYQAPLTMDGLLMKKELCESSGWLDHQLSRLFWTLSTATAHVHVIWKPAHASPMVWNVLRCVGFKVALTGW